METNTEPKKILIIDDDKEMSGIISDTLKENGFEVVCAFDGEEGLMIAKAQHPALILLDILMPKVDGMKLLQTLKTEAWSKHIPVIVLSNLGDMETISNTLMNNASDYLVKSDVDPETIVVHIKKKLREVQS